MNNTHKLMRLYVRRPHMQRLIDINVQGGQLTMKQKLISKAVDDGQGFEMFVDDTEMGEIIRHCGYGQGGWQDAMRQAFLTPVLKLMGAKL